MKTAVIYYSRHHGNTKKVLDAVAGQLNLTLIDVADAERVNLEEYDLIGFASGIYYSRFHKSVLKYAEQHLPQGKKVFFLYTYGARKEGYTSAIANVVKARGTDILGEYGCFGFNTFGPFKLIGGMAKGHPDQEELEKAAAFCRGLVSE